MIYFCFKDHQGCVTSGYWWCEGLTNYSIHVDQIYFVTCKLSFLTEYPRIESSPQVRNPYNVGEQLNLACIAQGKPAPKINWIKNGRIIPEETARFYHVNEVSVSDAGVYSCRASNQLGSVTSPGVHVHVQCKYFLILRFVFKPVLSLANSRASGNNLSCIYHLRLDVCFDEYRYRDPLQARLIVTIEKKRK